MMLKIINNPLWSGSRFGFASAAAAIDYYSLLGIERGATRDQIMEAFARSTRNVTPDSNPALYNRISEAFVILSDIKARDAYDSLMKSRRSSYINDPETQKKPNNYLADRKENRNKEISKLYNIDEFGRYRGGLPNRRGTIRGSAIGEIGTMHHINDFELRDHGDHPEYSKVDASVAESFKNFHQSEREYRSMKQTWATMKVDYEFFTFPKSRRAYWPFWRMTILLLFLLPCIERFNSAFIKSVEKKKGDWNKEEKKKRAAEKAAVEREARYAREAEESA